MDGLLRAEQDKEVEVPEPEAALTLVVDVVVLQELRGGLRLRILISFNSICTHGDRQFG